MVAHGGGENGDAVRDQKFQLVASCRRPPAAVVIFDAVVDQLFRLTCRSDCRDPGAVPELLQVPPAVVWLIRMHCLWTFAAPVGGMIVTDRCRTSSRLSRCPYISMVMVIGLSIAPENF